MAIKEEDKMQYTVSLFNSVGLLESTVVSASEGETHDEELTAAVQRAISKWIFMPGDTIKIDEVFSE